MNYTSISDTFSVIFDVGYSYTGSVARKPKKISAFDVALGGVVRSKRVKKNLTQAELAKLIGLPLSNYQRREDGTVEITTSELHRIAEIVGVSAADLAGEALEDYGGMQKLLEEHASTSDAADTLHDEGNVTYLGRVRPPMDAAADDNPRK